MATNFQLLHVTLIENDYFPQPPRWEKPLMHAIEFLVSTDKVRGYIIPGYFDHSPSLEEVQTVIENWLAQHEHEQE